MLQAINYGLSLFGMGVGLRMFSGTSGTLGISMTKGKP
jgi:hypothetical protein